MWSRTPHAVRCTLLILALGLGAAAQGDVLAQRGADCPGCPRTALALEKDAAEAAGDRLADLPGTDCGRLLLASGGRLFLIRPIRGAPGAGLEAFVVRAEQVEALRITGEYRSCP